MSKKFTHCFFLLKINRLPFNYNLDMGNLLIIWIKKVSLWKFFSVVKI